MQANTFVKTGGAMTIALMLGIAFAGCSPQDRANSVKTGEGSSNVMPMGKMAMPDPADIIFKDKVESNIEVPTGLDGLVFLDTAGNRVELKQYLGNKNVVLVFTEGFGGGMLCPFCKTQTSRLVANYDKFKELNTEILVVYPGARDHLDEFVEAAKQSEKSAVDSVPFPLVLDEDLSAVSYFNIASNLAHPSTFIIDKSGNVRLAYVGADMSADRPSIQAMLGVLSDANGS
jgi:peroxiredoxin